MGVEAPQFGQLEVEHGGDLLEMQVAIHDHRVGLDGQSGRHGADVVLAIVGHDVIGGDESGHVSAGLAGEIGVDFPVVAFAFGAVDGFVDVVGTGVVGGDDEVPVAEDAIEVAQIVGGGVGGFDDVAAFVDERVDFQTVLSACGEHKLPQPRGSYVRDGFGVEGRLDDGQVFQLQRQAVALEGLLEDG